MNNNWTQKDIQKFCYFCGSERVKNAIEVMLYKTAYEKNSKETETTWLMVILLGGAETK